ncbi:type II toxin-antitoxin system RelE family toxin [Dyadobacter sp. 32]|uniref:type II toxin-antitoxin system RelE family toxin n=1 Tax=Dyadobacter sp. 32 TaxID=538966 RepID=UPI0011F0304E
MKEIYRLFILNSAQKEIRKLPKTEAERIIRIIKLLPSDPRPTGCKKLVSTKSSYRIRIGNYRVLYLVDDIIRIVEVSAVKHRREAYE